MDTIKTKGDSMLPVSEDAFKTAIKRHEDKFEEELKNVDIKQVVLKTKKAVLEQARANAAMKEGVVRNDYDIKAINRKIEKIQFDMVSSKNSIISLINLIEKQYELETSGFFKRMWVKLFGAKR